MFADSDRLNDPCAAANMAMPRRTRYMSVGHAPARRLAVVFGCVLLGLGTLGLQPHSVMAQAPVPEEGLKEKQKSVSLMKQHPWATFSPGVWKTVRIISESFDKEGKPMETNLTDTKSTLLALTDQGVELKVEVSLWLAGRCLDPKPQQVKQGYHGEVGVFQTETIRELEPVKLTIEGKDVSCEVREITLTEPEAKRVRVIKLFYNEKVVPYLLRRESETRDVEKKTVLSKTTMVVNSLDMPWELHNRLFSVAVARTAKVTPKESITSLTFLAPEVPGQVVYEATKEVDPEGELIRRSVSRMTDFSVTQQRPGLLKRLRAAREQKKAELQGE